MQPRLRKKKILKTGGVIPSTAEAVLNVKAILGNENEALKVDAAGIAVEEGGARCDILSDESREIEVAQWAWKALKQERIFCFNSRMRCLALSLPSGHLALHNESDGRASVLDHRQRAMASVVLHALTEASTHRRHQLEEVNHGAGSLRIPSLDNPSDQPAQASRMLDVRLRW
eukprot:TRINITY_DN17552_c0_g1_i1.p1 TRINITY_DN17552_c0_g1~~TRINITY_DN17552_c0_g1_i1.p1  ORF type:complete len:190 (+),score=39.82 TRINITY_DN17552_c0_g1_i1:54-572(+)